MSSIPLPALHIQSPEQPGPLSQVAKVLSVRSLLAQQQGQQLELQKQKQAVVDQQATTQAMRDWDGKSYDDLAQNVLRNGGSAQSAQAIAAHGLQVRETASKIAKDDAETGKTELNTTIDRQNQLLGRLDAAKSAPDTELAQHLQGALKSAVDSKFLKPEEASQLWQQVSQLPPDQQRNAVSLYEKSLMGQKEQFAQAQEQEKTKTAQQNAATSEWKEAGQGTLVNVKTREIIRGFPPVDQAELQDYLSKNPGKGPWDYAQAKSKLAPQAQLIVANAAGGAMSGDATDQAAEYYHLTGKLPPGGRGAAGIAQNRKIMNRAAELFAGSSMGEDTATYSANKKSLDGLQKQSDAVSAFENTAGKNLDIFLDQAKNVIDSGSPLINKPIRSLAAQLAGSKDQTAFNTARTTALTEIAKVLNSPTGSGVLSDSARHEVEGLIGKDATLKQIYSAASILKQDMANRHQSYSEQIDDIKSRLSPKKGGPQAQPAISVGAVITQNGHKFKVTAVDGSGKPTAAYPIQ